MSGFTVGVFAGALAGTAIYYTFSHSIQVDSQISRGKLKALSAQLSAPPAELAPITPLPAASRIPDRRASNDLKARWNEDIEGLFYRARNLNVEVRWGEMWDKVKGVVDGAGK